MKALDKQLLNLFIEKAADRLDGEWLVMGGAALSLMGVSFRPTMDIDLAGPADAPMSQGLILMEIAEELGLPVEAVNQSGAFFLRRIANWRGHTVAVAKGRNATLLRPDATLFVLLKLGRLTETDLSDCLAVLKHSAPSSDETAVQRLVDEIEAHLQNEPAPGRLERLQRLLEAVQAIQSNR